MKQFIAIAPATGKIYLLTAKDAEGAYKLFGRVVMKMTGDFETVNVDIELEEVRSVPTGTVLQLFKGK